LTKAEKLLTYLQMFKPLTRKIKIRVLQAFQLPIPRGSMLKSVVGKGSKPFVQSRVLGVYPEADGCAALSPQFYLHHASRVLFTTLCDAQGDALL
jgi:hypothetical protein